MTVSIILHSKLDKQNFRLSKFNSFYPTKRIKLHTYSSCLCSTQLLLCCKANLKT